ncbi:C2 calcium-dependent domain-containing protein 4C-like [Arapaima gigas]
MWLLGKIKESTENLSTELNAALRAHAGISAKASFSTVLHSNILTPDKIPDFFIPPKLTRNVASHADYTLDKWKPLSLGPEINIKNLIHTGMESDGHSPSKGYSDHVIMMENVDKSPTSYTAGKPEKSTAASKRLLQPRQYYGLIGLYESPNTRRKESLFHSELTSYSLERNPSRSAWGPRPVSYCKALSEQGSTESDTPSSADSSPHGSPPLTRSGSTSIFFKLLGQESSQGHSTPSTSRHDLTAEEAPPPRLASGPKETAVHQVSLSSSLRPPVLFPLDLLQCQERLQKEHVLPLLGRGRIRLSAELDPANATVRIRVVSVEDLHDAAHDGRLVHCCVSMCLTPGKHQRQTSATVRNCRNPIFNEDFFFTQLTEDSLQTLLLRVKVLDKASSLKRDVVLGIISKPLSQLLPFFNFLLHGNSARTSYEDFRGTRILGGASALSTAPWHALAPRLEIRPAADLLLATDPGSVRRFAPAVSERRPSPGADREPAAFISGVGAGWGAGRRLGAAPTTW